MSAVELARVLIGKGVQDELVLEKLAEHPEVPVAALGFHAQQAAEKLLKALLAVSGVEYPFTHRLEVLLDLATDHKVSLPPGAESLRALTPFAVQYRYEQLDEEEDETGFDTDSIRRHLCELREWVVVLLDRVEQVDTRDGASEQPKVHPPTPPGP